MVTLINRLAQAVLWVGAAAVGATLLMSCIAPMEVVSDHDSSVDFAQYRSYAWIADMPLIAAEDSAVSLTQFDVQRIETAIESELAAKGYRRVELDEAPCFVISFTVGARDKITIESFPDRYRGVWYGRWPHYGPQADSYEIDDLGIDVFDETKKEPVWHGAVTKGTSADSQLPIDEAVRAIIAQFPPAA